MKQYGKIVADYVKDINLLDPNTLHHIDSYKMEGFKDFCKAQLEEKRTPTKTF